MYFFFILLAGLLILITAFKYGMGGKSLKFYLFFFLLLVGPALIYLGGNLVRSDLLKVFYWVPFAALLVWCLFWVIRYLENLGGELNGSDTFVDDSSKDERSRQQ